MTHKILNVTEQGEAIPIYILLYKNTTYWNYMYNTAGLKWPIIKAHLFHEFQQLPAM